MKIRKMFLIGLIIASVILIAAAPIKQAQAGNPQPLTADMLVAFFAAGLSLLFSYFPGLNTWYAGLKELWKYLIMIAGLAIISAGAYGIACAGFASWLGYTLACSNEGLVYLLGLFLEAIMANQTVYKISPPAKSVQLVKAAVKQP